MMFWPYMMGGFLGRGFGIFGMIFQFIFFLAILAGIIILIVWLVKKANIATSNKPDNKPLDILNERFAKGEISKEEYENMKKTLKE